MSTYQQLIQLKKDIEEVQKDLKNGTIVREIGIETALYVFEDVNEIFEQGVEEYYESYDPIFYKRTYSLKEAFKVTRSGSVVNWETHAGLMPDTHRIGTGYIYEFMFKQGYHGGAIGANALGGAMWRAPHPSQGRPAYSHWGRAAVQTKAPWDIIDEKINAYESSDLIQGYLSTATDLVLGRYNLFANY